MIIKQPLTNYIHIDKMTDKKKELSYRVHKDVDGSSCVLFESVNSSSKRIHKIYNSHKSSKIITPNIFKKYFDRHIFLYHEKINDIKNELFRAKISGINNCFCIKHFDPFFTSSSLTIPWFYINSYLDSSASALRVSINLTDVNVISNGQIRMEFVYTKDKIKSYPLYMSTNGLKTRGMDQLTNMVNSQGKVLEDFRYIGVVETSFSDFGVLIFKEKYE